MDTINTNNAKWTKWLNNPKYKVEAQRNKKMIPDMKRVMLDPERRQLEAKAAQAEITSQRKVRQAELEQQLSILQVNKQIPQLLVEGLTKGDFKDFSFDEIRIVAQRMDLRVTNGGATGTETFTPPPTLEPAKMSAIGRNLRAIEKQDLYDFLELSRSTASSDLVNKADMIYKDSQKGKRDDISNARAALAGEAKVIFSSADQHTRYNNSINEQQWDDVKSSFDNIARTMKRIQAAQFDNLVLAARNKGLDATEAAQRIRFWAQQRKVPIEVTQNYEIIDKLPQCPNCFQVDETRKAAACTACGTRLRINCPSCKTDNRTEYRGCTTCGYPVGNHLNASVSLERALVDIRNGDLERAIDTLRFTQRVLWPPIFDSNPVNDDLTREIQTTLQMSKDKLQTRSDTISKITAARDKRRYYEVRTLLTHLPRSERSDELDEIEIQARDAIEQAEKMVHMLQAPNNRMIEVDIINQVERILSICADCQPARAILEKHPPSPPGIIHTQVSDNIIALRWQKTISPNARYTVVRKAKTQPVALQDGEKLADSIVGTTFEDVAPPNGVPLYYAVYADRQGVFSTEAPVSQPVMRTDPPAQVTAKAGDTHITLAWQHPEQAVSVTVRRAAAQPIKLRVAGQTARDENLKNGKTYTYQVTAQYRDTVGQLVNSEPVIVHAIPNVPPKPIQNLCVAETRAEKTLLEWTPDPRANTYLLLCNGKVSLTEGETYPLKAIEAYGKLIQAPGQKLWLTLPSMVLTSIVPLTEVDNTVTIGRAFQHVGLDEVERLNVRLNKNSISITWHWPPNCQEVRLSYSHRDYPDSDRAEATMTQVITRADYNLYGGQFTVDQPKPKDHFFIVQTVLQQGHEMLASNGVRTSAHLASRITIRYEIKRRMMRKPQLKLSFDGHGMVPNILLVAQQRIAPDSINTGSVVMVIPLRPINGQIELVEELEPPRQSNTVYRLFLEDESAYESRGGHIIMLHPPKDRASL
jgi:hypothetical protein